MNADIVYHEHPTPRIEMTLDDSTKITRPVQEGETAKESAEKMLRAVGSLTAAVVWNLIDGASAGAPHGDAI